MNNFINFVVERKSQIYDLFIEHIELTIFAVLISVIIGIPLGMFIIRSKKISTIVIGIANVTQSIPSIALLGFLIPVLGIGSKPAIAMVVLYSLLPIIKNTFTGLNNISGSIIEAARGMGLTKRQILIKVQLPLAMPIIMSGIRISAVTAVGLMTIAAFVGAGGLGYLVFSGVQTVNNNMILAGAIPACFLAIILDFIIGKIEYVVTPTGILQSKGKKNIRKIDKKKLKPILAVILAILVATVGVVSYKEFTKKTIVVGSKNFNEQLILGNMLSSLIEKNTDYKVDRKLNLGGGSVVFNALKSGSIDLYVEYTGTGLVNIMGEEPLKDEEKVYNIVRDYFIDNYQLEWLKPLGFNNTYVLAMTKDLANKYNINTISDLKKVDSELNLGCTMEFANRVDGYPGLKEVYGVNFNEVKGLDGGLRYSSLDKNQTQITDAFATDGLIKKFDLKLLEDDKNFFPPYYAAPLVRQETLEKYPELKPLLLKLEGTITDDVMRELNYRADEGEDPKAIAEEFLKSKGLIE
ncbi:glycine betaine ABC transporter substrate-binding protein [Clostridium sp. BJN0001]|uniref:ABC transporter permease/substrate-binding protein n=1 Tax=Clostridium sp. BJN0001 TaxID=2930219 RepID=UPI001FD5F3C6|nr:glycine betaine ABC transporter substrate-binding protein [Clostridium sp. BJN0001]